MADEEKKRAYSDKDLSKVVVPGKTKKVEHTQERAFMDEVEKERNFIMDNAQLVREAVVREPDKVKNLTTPQRLALGLTGLLGTAAAGAGLAGAARGDKSGLKAAKPGAELAASSFMQAITGHSPHLAKMGEVDPKMLAEMNKATGHVAGLAGKGVGKDTTTITGTEDAPTKTYEMDNYLAQQDRAAKNKRSAGIADAMTLKNSPHRKYLEVKQSNIANWEDEQRPRVMANLAKYNRALNIFENAMKEGRPLSGPISGFVASIPVIGEIAKSDLLEVERLVGGVEQQNLRQTLGGQFAQREGEDLLKRAFTKHGDATNNYIRMIIGMNAIKAAHELKLQEAEYMKANPLDPNGFDYAGKMQELNEQMHAALEQAEAEYGGSDTGGKGARGPNEAHKSTLQSIDIDSINDEAEIDRLLEQYGGQ